MRHYSSVAQATTLTAGVTAGETSIQVASTTGLPMSHPFTLVLSPGTAEEEIVTVTATAGTTLSVVRGEDGSTAMSHSAGAEVRHMVTARDLREAQEHINATSDVHGTTGTLVTTSAVQTLTNKTIDAAQNTLLNLPTSTPTATAVDTLTGDTLPYTSGTIAGAASGIVLVTATYSLESPGGAGDVEMSIQRGTLNLVYARGTLYSGDRVLLSATVVDPSPNGDGYTVYITGPSGASLVPAGKNTFGVIRF